MTLILILQKARELQAKARRELFGNIALAVLTLEAAAVESGASDPATGTTDSVTETKAAGTVAATELALPYSVK